MKHILTNNTPAPGFLLVRQSVQIHIAEPFPWKDFLTNELGEYLKALALDGRQKYQRLKLNFVHVSTAYIVALQSRKITVNFQ